MPIFVYEIFYGWPLTPDDVEKVSKNSLYRIFMWLKLFRYFEIASLSLAIKRIFDYLSDIFYLRKIMF